MSSGRHLAAVVESDYSDIADIDGAKASYYVISILFQFNHTHRVKYYLIRKYRYRYS